MDFRRDWFRTLLSLLGVCIGVFSITAVFTFVDSLQSTIREGFEQFGSETVFVEKEPMEPDLNEDGIFRWWEYISRPPVSYSDYQYLRSHSRNTAKMAFCLLSGNAAAVDGDWTLIASTAVESGRSFSQEELSKGRSVAIVGHELCREIFKNGENPLGRSIKISGKNFSIVGVLEKCGANTVSTIDTDNTMLIPYKASSHTQLQGLTARSSISAVPAKGCNAEEYKAELRSLMRAHRRLRPFQEDNFAINSISFIIDQMSEIFRLVNIMGWIIGLFSLIVGGFNIANIMFVAVQERTREIGIQRALGARRMRILTEYLLESCILSLSGGVTGVFLVWIVTVVIPSSSVNLHLGMKNIVTGISISLVIGIISGIAPSIRASRMNPVQAINS